MIAAGISSATVAVAATPVEAVVVNGGFETPFLRSDYAYGPARATWSFAESAGITGNDTPFTSANPDAPEGLQVAFLQNHGAFAQVIDISAGVYAVSFRAAQRLAYQYGNQVVQVLIDGVEVGRYAPTAGDYTLYQTPPFTINASGSHTLALAGVGTGSDFTAFVDDVKLIVPGGATATATDLASSANPGRSGTAVTLTAAVSGAAPTGNVQFTDGGVTIAGCSAVVVSGIGNRRTAICSTSALAVGSHTIVASYGGDAVNAGSISNVLTQSITPGPSATTTTVRSSANPASAGTSITFTATVTGNAPTGAVNFTADNASIAGCSAAMLSGAGNARTATCTTSNLGPGAHGIVAAYVGDGGNAASGSSALTEQITGAAADTTTALASSSNPSNLGSSVVFTATVTGTSPTGSVSFTDAGASIPGCAASVVSGTGNIRTATCTTNNLSAGDHSIVATYSGNAVNAPSKSVALSHTVTGAVAAGLPNAGFETPKLFADYAYAPRGANWTFNTGAGIAGNGNAFTSGNPQAPEGSQVGFLQNQGTAMQTISLVAGVYTISLRAAQRLNYQDGV